MQLSSILTCGTNLFVSFCRLPVVGKTTTLIAVCLSKNKKPTNWQRQAKPCDVNWTFVTSERWPNFLGQVQGHVYYFDIARLPPSRATEIQPLTLNSTRVSTSGQHLTLNFRSQLVTVIRKYQNIIHIISRKLIKIYAYFGNSWFLISRSKGQIHFCHSCTYTLKTGVIITQTFWSCDKTCLRFGQSSFRDLWTLTAFARSRSSSQSPFWHFETFPVEG